MLTCTNLFSRQKLQESEEILYSHEAQTPIHTGNVIRKSSLEWAACQNVIAAFALEGNVRRCTLEDSPVLQSEEAAQLPLVLDVSALQGGLREVQK